MIENMMSFLFGFFVWSFGAVMSIFAVGQKCSCYFPFLLSSKLYYVVKNPRMQRLLIAARRNRSPDTATALEDRDKLAFIGCIYYIIDGIWILISYILFFGLLISYLISEDALSVFVSRVENISYFLFSPNYLIFMGIMMVLYQIDYSIGLYYMERKH